jgi:hypothetical protein
MSNNERPPMSRIWIALAACWVLGLITLLAQCST